MAVKIIESPIGKLFLETLNGKVKRLDFLKDVEEYQNDETDSKIDLDLLDKSTEELNEYFAGIRTNFDLPLEFDGTEYQIKVWNELKKIPYGKTCSYKEISLKLGSEKASRSVGMACGRNKIMIMIPCHRVIGSNGKLTGFAGGIDKKIELLNLENNTDYR
jgi:methylated-DNA-[protein]-cysteine S-methyltransferase